jgi:hypothetical protein
MAFATCAWRNHSRGSCVSVFVGVGERWGDVLQCVCVCEFGRGAGRCVATYANHERHYKQASHPTANAPTAATQVMPGTARCADGQASLPFPFIHCTQALRVITK